MNLDWLAPAYDDAKEPFIVDQGWIRKTSLMMSGYILLILYPAYIGLRYLWTGQVFDWHTSATAVASAIAFGFFAYGTMDKFFRIRGAKVSS